MIKVNNIEISKDTFGAGEFKMSNIDIKVFDYPIMAATVEWKFEDNSEIFLLKIVKDWIDEHYPKAYVDLYMPYIPYARMDRVKEKNDFFTLKSFASLINSMNFNNVIVLDPHSDVSTALIDRITVKNVEPYISNTINRILKYIVPEDLVICFPDYGAYKRYSDLSILDRFPKIYGKKVRDWKTHKIEKIDIDTCGIPVENLNSKTFLIIDDIVSYGGTFKRLIEELSNKFSDSKFFTYATHTENVVDKGDFWKLIEGRIVCKHYTTDTIYNRELKNIEVVW